jgi:hypothetical protein
MSAALFGQQYEDEPAGQLALFADVAPAVASKPERPSRTYRGGQQVMACAWCYAVAGPFVRTAGGIAYCPPCAREIQRTGHGPLLK